MDMEDDLEKLKRLETEARSGGSQEAVAKQHDAGKLTARERIDHFFDKGSFVELNMFAQHQCKDFEMEKKRPLGDGVITGYGTVEGRQVFLYAQDFTAIGGSVGFTHSEKICKVIRMARESGVPVVGLIDSSGARIQEGSGAYSMIFYENVKASGVVPQISAVMGNCAGGGAYSPALTDFVLMVEGKSQMFITGPSVIKTVTGQEIGMQELGGAKPHSTISGVCDFVAEDDEDCLKLVKRLLGLLPSNYKKTPPRLYAGDDPDRCDEGLLEIVPESIKKPYDMHKIITKVVDNGEFFEIKSKFAPNMITGLARLNGYTVGIVANQPTVLAGSIDCDASDKAARFYRFCDSFNIPIVTFVDVPGYLPGVDQEYKGIIRHGAKMLYGFCEATVPKLTCIIRKAYGGAFAAMGPKVMGADIIFAWPTAEVAIMGPEGAVDILYRKEIQTAKDKVQFKEQKIKEYREKFTTPYYGASSQRIDIIIKPSETRPQLIKALEILKDKAQTIPERKHGLMPV
jgi:acetyl-CoA carboxylase carboxyltransferase component